MLLENKTALLIGARRMGHTLATALASRGADVALGYHRSRAEADAAAEAVRRLGRRALVLPVDVTDPASASTIVNHAAAELGRLDVLINMASTYEPVAFDELDEAVWDRQLAVDLRGAFSCSRAAVPHMRAVGGGRIINFTDWVAASDRPRYKGYLAYYVAKAGVKALTEALALELAADNILVNAIAPGPILAPAEYTANQLKAVEKATPLGRWGGTDEVAKAVLALIDSDFMTGETIRIDGGRHVS